jgi:glutamate formiminotransferase / 5-formyltetrahydrofolate cyclo-ligase
MNASGLLLGVPNVSEGRDTAALDAIAAAFARGGARLLDVHSDPDHHRAVFSMAAAAGALAEAMLEGAREVVARVDVSQHAGEHPRVGAVDVAPVVYRTAELRGAATAEALVLAELLGSELELPVFLYGDVAGGRTRAQIRRGGPAGELLPDYGPQRLHPTAGAVLVSARPPLLAFNVELAPPATLAQARDIAARIREGGPEGLPGLRALGLHLERQGIIQVTTNIEDTTSLTAAEVVAAVRRHAPVQGAEVVAMAEEHALEGFPDDVPIRGFDPARQIIERVL